MRYVRARVETENRETAYKIYMTDSIYYYTQNKGLSERYADLLKKKPTKVKSAQEIVDETFLKAGLKFKE